jgi:glycosyltransferase involved in cell wall biosynthesis
MHAGITVVIPCLNAAPFLHDALGSVRAQSRQPDKVILVDDGSTDGSVAIAREFGVTILETSGRRGPSTARNLGWRAATQPLIAFLDADDLWASDHLETLAGALEVHPTVELAYSGVQSFGTMMGIRPNPLPPHVPTDSRVAAAMTCFVPQMAVMIRRSALEASGGYDEMLRVAEDFDLFARLAHRAPFVTTGRTTAMYRQHSAQTTRRQQRAVALASVQVRERNYEAFHCAAGSDEDQRLREAVRAAWTQDIRYAWSEQDREGFDALLELCHSVPEGIPVARAWRRRATFLWYPWRAASAIWRSLPARPSGLQRWVSRTVLGTPG